MAATSLIQHSEVRCEMCLQVRCGLQAPSARPANVTCQGLGKWDHSQLGWDCAICRYMFNNYSLIIAICRLG